VAHQVQPRQAWSCRSARAFDGANGVHSVDGPLYLLRAIGMPMCNAVRAAAPLLTCLGTDAESWSAMLPTVLGAHALHTTTASNHPSAGSVMDRSAPGETSGRGRGRFFIHTFGCQMNLADSERMAGALEAGGYTCTTDAAQADVLVYNTCSIREKAENKVYSALGRQAQRKRAHFPDVKIVVAGCVAQQEGQQLLRRVPEVDLVMGPQHANQITHLLDQAHDGQALPVHMAAVATAGRHSRRSTCSLVPCCVAAHTTAD
jgi:Uncharacterized protein family UPF0004